MINQSHFLVSTIIPTYNRAHVLGCAVQSVLNQTYRNFELLIIDDGSVDNTEEIVNAFDDSRIYLYKHDKNLGQTAALNTGLLIAKGKYIAFLDSDDEWLPQMLEKQVRVFREDDSLGVVYTWAGTYRAGGVLKPVVKFSSRGYINKQALIQGYVSHMITMMVKKTCYDSVGLLDINFDNCNDDDICLRLAREYRFGLIPEILAIVHDDGGSQITKDSKSYADGWWRLFTKHEKEIRRVCGDRILAKHYARCAWLYIKASDMKDAEIALKKAARIDDSLRLWDLKIATRIAPSIMDLFLRMYEKVRRAKRPVQKWRLSKFG